MADNIQLNMLTLLHELQCFNKNLINKNVKSLADYLTSLKEDFDDKSEQEENKIISYGLFELFLKYIKRIHTLVNIEKVTDSDSQKVIDNNIAASTLNALFKDNFALLIAKLKKHIELETEVENSLTEWIEKVLAEDDEIVIKKIDFEKYEVVTEKLNGEFLKSKECWEFITDLTNLLYESIYVNIIDIPIMEIQNIPDLPESIVVELKSHLANSAGSRRKFIYPYVEADGYPIDDSTLSLRTYIETYHSGYNADDEVDKALKVINQSTKLGQSILAPIFYNIKLIELILDSIKKGQNQESIKEDQNEKTSLYVYNSIARDALDYHKRCNNDDEETRKAQYEQLIAGIAKGNIEEPTKWLYKFLEASLSRENKKYEGLENETILKKDKDNFNYYNEHNNFRTSEFPSTKLNPKFVDLIHELILIIEIIYLSHSQTSREESKRSSKFVNYFGENIIYDTYKNVFIKKARMSTRDGEDFNNTLSGQLINCLVILYNKVYGGEELTKIGDKTLLYIRRFYNCLLNIGEDEYGQNIRDTTTTDSVDNIFDGMGITPTNDTSNDTTSVTNDGLEDAFKFNIMRDFECVTPYIHSVVESVIATKNDQLVKKLNAYFRIISMYIRESLKGKVDSIEGLIEKVEKYEEGFFTDDNVFKDAFVGFNNMLIQKEDGTPSHYFRADMFSINYEILKALKELKESSENKEVPVEDKLILLCFVLVINNLMNIHNLEGKKFFEILKPLENNYKQFSTDLQNSKNTFGGDKAPRITSFSYLDRFIKNHFLNGTVSGNKVTVNSFSNQISVLEDGEFEGATGKRVYYRYYPRRLNAEGTVFTDSQSLLEVEIVVHENENENKKVYCITNAVLLKGFGDATFKATP